MNNGFYGTPMPDLLGAFQVAVDPLPIGQSQVINVPHYPRSLLRVTATSRPQTMVLSPGVFQGQEFWLVYESGPYYLTFDASATSHVANGTSCSLAPKGCLKFVWDATLGLWFESGPGDFNPSLFSGHGLVPPGSGTSHKLFLCEDGNWTNPWASTSQTIATNGTITTNSFTFGHTVVVVNSSNTAVTGLILQAGFYGGQPVIVINTNTAGSMTFAAASSNVVDGSSDVIAPGTSRLFVWDAGTSLWYPSR